MPTLTRNLLERHWYEAGKQPVLLFSQGQGRALPQLDQLQEFQPQAGPKPPELILCLDSVPLEIPQLEIWTEADMAWVGWALQLFIEPEFPATALLWFIRTEAFAHVELFQVEPQPVKVAETVVEDVLPEQFEPIILTSPKPKLQPKPVRKRKKTRPSKTLQALRRFFSFSWISWERTLHHASQVAYAGAIALAAIFFTPMIVIESQTKLAQVQNHLASIRIYSQTTDPVLPAESTPTPEPVINSAEDYFSIKIPSLNIESRIIPNVNPSNSEEYESALKEGVAHAMGSGLPDDLSLNHTTYLFAHSTNAVFNIKRYNAQFYALKDAKAGDEIMVRYWGKDYTYKIEEVKIVDADDTTYLAPQHDTPLLVLQTCYPPGTTWKRLLVIAKPVEAQP